VAWLIHTGFLGFLGRIERAVGRVNTWFGATAVASDIEQQGRPNASPLHPIGVVTVVNEIERTDDDPSRTGESAGRTDA